jgi:HSP20 family protein
MLVRRLMPVQELVELQRDLMQFVGRTLGSETAEVAAFVANTEAYFKDGQLVIRVELAGVDPKDVEVSVAGRTLTIKGERKAPKVPADDRLFGEIVYGKFERMVTLPEGLNPEEVKARWDYGILEVTIPVNRPPQPKKVPVEVEQP